MHAGQYKLHHIYVQGKVAERTTVFVSILIGEETNKYGQVCFAFIYYQHKTEEKQTKLSMNYICCMVSIHLFLLCMIEPIFIYLFMHIYAYEHASLASQEIYHIYALGIKQRN